MLNLLWKMMEDDSDAEAKALAEMLKQHPELPEWSAAVQPVLDRLLHYNGIQKPLACRVLSKMPFNALALAQECLKQGDEVEVTFIGAGTRWPAELTKVAHPFNALYNSVREVVKGASSGCAAAFGATAGVQACGIPESKANAVSGTPGLLSVRRYLAEGWNTLIF